MVVVLGISISSRSISSRAVIHDFYAAYACVSTFLAATVSSTNTATTVRVVIVLCLPLLLGQ